jgi:hypothetical protein
MYEQYITSHNYEHLFMAFLTMIVVIKGKIKYLNVIISSQISRIK